MSDELTKDGALDAVRAAAWWTEVETCGHRGCEEHLGEGKQRIHTYLGGFGAALTTAATDLTLADLVREVERLDGDPETTTVTIHGVGPVLTCEYNLNRRDGALVVEIDWESDEDGWESLDAAAEAVDAALEAAGAG